MPYKEKVCPKCAKPHTKRGPFCSQSCSSKRKHTEETKAKIAASQTAFMTSDNDVAEEARWRLNNHENQEHYEPIAPQKSINISPNQFVQDGDLWSTD